MDVWEGAKQSVSSGAATRLSWGIGWGFAFFLIDLWTFLFPGLSELVHPHFLTSPFVTRGFPKRPFRLESLMLPPRPEMADEDVQWVGRLRHGIDAVRRELAKVIVGQSAVIDQLLLALCSGGHCLLEGVPGLAKTLLVSTLARSLKLDFRRIQFTPDLMPSDITGTEIIQDDRATGERGLRFLPGPVFANVILADEVNRTPPKTQSALLEAMQERQVTVGGQRRPLPAPFFVLATQNPIEQEGTYTLPEAQQDRFMFKIFVRYPNYDEEFQIADLPANASEVGGVIDAGDLLRFQEVVRRVPVASHVKHYALRLVRATRSEDESSPKFVKDWITWGVGPRGLQYLLLAAKARAAMDGRYTPTIEDIRAIALPTLRHRLVTNFVADSNGVSTDQVVIRLLAEIPERQTGDEIAAELKPAFAAG